jgi:virulence factor Mce-like protein
VRGGRAGSLAASPTLVGAVTVLIVVVAVFLSYQANEGLPFVPTYRVSAQVENANTLVPGNEVRIGGLRVGQINDVRPVQNEDGSVNAVVDMELNADLEELPEDSTLIVRSRTALGLKYLEVQRGESEDGFAPGSTIPLSAARPEPVEIDEVFNTFDTDTRAAIQVNLTEFGNSLAGRGGNLNAVIGDLRPLVERLEPVMRNLSAPETGLGRFVRGLSAAAAEAAPVAEVQGQLFVDLERTFQAFADVSRPYIQDFIEKGPPTEDVAIATLPTIRPLLLNTAGLFHDLRPGFAALRPVSRDFALAISIGVKAVRVSPALNNQLDPTATSLLNFNNNATVREGIDDLDALGRQLSPLFSFVGPSQSVCNYASLLFRNVSSHLSIGDGIGTNQRFIAFAPPSGPNNEGSPASAPANGNGSPSNFLHVNPYPNTAAPGQVRECEAGNETPYIGGQQVIGNMPGNQGIKTSGQIAAQLCKPNQKLVDDECVKKKKKKKKKK